MSTEPPTITAESLMSALYCALKYREETGIAGHPDAIPSWTALLERMERGEVPTVLPDPTFIATS